MARLVDHRLPFGRIRAQRSGAVGGFAPRREHASQRSTVVAERALLPAVLDCHRP